MKFTCQREDLLKIFQASEPITGSKTNFSILANVLIETRDSSSITVKASNMESTLEGILPAKVAEPGSITLYQIKLNSIIKELPPSEVLIELGEGNRVSVRSLDKKRNVKAVMTGIPKTDFPELPDFPENQPSITLDKLYFKRMIQKTIFAVSNDTSKYTLNGILFEVKDKAIKMVAIDGRRLALINSPLNDPEASDFSTIIPQQVLSQVQKIIHSEGPIQISINENRIHFKFDSLNVSSNTLQGKFPNYNMLIPAESKYHFNSNTSELAQAVSLASVVTDRDSNKLIWDLRENTLGIVAQDQDQSSSNEEIFIKYEGEAMKIGLNYKLLSEILREIETEEISFLFSDALSPIMVKENQRDEFFFIIMPMKLDE